MLNKRPMGLDVLLENHATWPLTKVPEVAHTLSQPQGSDLSCLIFPLCAAFSKLWVDFQNYHICAWNLATGQSSRSCTYTLCQLQGVEMELVFTLWAVVSEIQTNFKITILGMKHGHRPKFQKLHTYSLSTPDGGRNWAYFYSMSSGFQDMGRFQNCHIWAWILVIGQSSRRCTYVYTLFPPQGGGKGGGGQNWVYFWSMGSSFRHTGRVSKLPYLGMKLGHWPSRSSTCAPFLPQGVEIKLIFTLRAAVSEIFKTVIFGYETWPLAKVPEVAHVVPILPPSPKFHFTLLYRPFLRYWQFSILTT